MLFCFPVLTHSWKRKAKVTTIFNQSASVIVSKVLSNRDNLLPVLIYPKFFILKEVLQIKIHLVSFKIHFLHHTVYK